jgi:hypothetical protein
MTARSIVQSCGCDPSTDRRKTESRSKNCRTCRNLDDCPDTGTRSEDSERDACTNFEGLLVLVDVADGLAAGVVPGLSGVGNRVPAPQAERIGDIHRIIAGT